MVWWRHMAWYELGIMSFFNQTKHRDNNTWHLPTTSLQWRHNDNDSVSNHQPRGCLPNRLFRRRSKKTSKLHVTGLCVGNSPGPVNSPHKGPVTRKMFPFDDVIMICLGNRSIHNKQANKTQYFSSNAYNKNTNLMHTNKSMRRI